MSFLCLSVYLVTLLTLKHLYGKKSYCVNLFSNTIRYNSTWFGTTMGWVVCSFLFYSIEQFYVEGTRHFCVFKLIITMVIDLRKWGRMLKRSGIQKMTLHLNVCLQQISLKIITQKGSCQMRIIFRFDELWNILKRECKS